MPILPRIRNICVKPMLCKRLEVLEQDNEATGMWSVELCSPRCVDSAFQMVYTEFIDVALNANDRYATTE